MAAGQAIKRWHTNCTSSAVIRFSFQTYIADSGFFQNLAIPTFWRLQTLQTGFLKTCPDKLVSKDK
jgi:hypothetical protein